MKFVNQIIVTAAICLVLQYFLPWWTMAIGAAFVGFYFGNKGPISFFAGFLAVGILWFVMAMTVDSMAHSGLAQKISQVLPINAFVMTTLIGALVGGFAALSGSLLKTRK